MTIPTHAGQANVSADDLLATLVLCLLNTEPKNLLGEARFLDNVSTVFYPEASLDHRGYCITTFVCAADYLRSMGNKEFDGLVKGVSKLFE
eukprot:CAMPEP_0167798134 /NCGR_PEP_ID=MMETSP0111_2-20121227/16112_1 /TAXON_ID=91324 /ORGANISM="Lotharella globosa, Strain CCCM811" /LENGTH=90 /DNA_ID=CAMNT_0007692459 /DNA_START=98 /DNA_END=370 /DNA_ORIENTATION=+